MRCGKCGSEAAQAMGQKAEAAPQLHAERARPFAGPTGYRVLPSLALRDDDWALDAELRGVRRLVASLKGSDYRPTPVSGGEETPRGTTPVQGEAADNQQPAAGHTLVWCLLSLGLAIFACGAVLLGWSVVGKRPDLWPVGMPLTLLGQAGLILGLVLQLEGLWTTSKKTAVALRELDGELKNVRQATTLLTTTKSGGAQSFYLHLAEGASPHLLLADLKGQMDLLAQQMARER